MAAELKARFTADDSDLTRKMKGIERNLGRFGATVAGLVSVAAMAGFARQIISSAKEANDLGDALRIPVRNVEVLQQLGQEVGTSMEKIVTGVSKIDNSRVEALNDATSNAAKSMAKLGITTEELETLTASQFLERFGRAIKESEGDVSKLSAVTDILGVKGYRMKEVLRSLSEDGFDKLAVSMQAAGEIMGDDLNQSVAQAEMVLNEFGDRMTVIGAKAIGGLMSIGTFAKGFWASLLGDGNSWQDMLVAGWDEVDKKATALRNRLNKRESIGQQRDAAASIGKADRISESIRTSSIGAIGGKIGTGFGASNLDAMERQQVGLQKDIKGELVKLNSKSSDFGVR
jgi:hypothetical protein